MGAPRRLQQGGQVRSQPQDQHPKGNGAGQLNLFERWESDEHLGAHQKAEHSRTFQRSLRDCGVAGASVDRYEVSGVTKIL